MTAITVSTSRIRKINIQQDLLAVADLIEICFASTLDDDGREYLRNLRSTARDANTLTWLQGAAERLASPLYGFVWEESGRIIGNLSLIPVTRRGKTTYLIANVAVHPDYRGRGIGHQLTQTAIDHVRQRGLDTAWLQVRDDNPIAYRLYRSLGFVERARRTTWMSNGLAPLSLKTPDGLSIRPRNNQDWALQRKWLNDIYPPVVFWNLPISFKWLAPSPLKQLLRWLQGESQHNWALVEGEQPVGFVSWEPMRAASDALWIGTTSEGEDKTILSLLPYARGALANHRRPLSINYPAGRGGEAFLRAGFSHHQTLIWMEVNLYAK